MIFFELTVFALFILIIVSIVWSTIRTGISPMQSSGKARHAMIAAIENAGSGDFIELGSGLGVLACDLARAYPDRIVIGYELSFVPWFFSVILKKMFGLKNLSFYRKDFTKANFDNAAVLFCYLFPGGMISLENKLKRELDHDALIISNTFAFPSFKAEKTTRLKDVYRTPVYVYFWKPVIPVETH